MVIYWDFMGYTLLVSSNMVCWKIPELNGGFQLGKSLSFMVPFPASHVNPIFMDYLIGVLDHGSDALMVEGEDTLMFRGHFSHSDLAIFRFHIQFWDCRCLVFTSI